MSRRRKTKLSREVQDKIVLAAVNGMPRSLIASYAGIAASTLSKWIARGETEIKGKYREFLEALNEAEAKFVANNVAIIQRAAQGTWTASAWLLERRRPQDFALNRSVKVDLKNEEGQRTQIKIDLTGGGNDPREEEK